MSLPMGEPTLELTHPDRAPSTSPLVLDIYTASLSTFPEFQEKTQGEQLEDKETKFAIGLPIQGFTSR